jgi:hypothetical protein
MARSSSWLRSALVCSLFAMLACSSSEPTDGQEGRPELVYAERDERTGLWSIQGYNGRVGVTRDRARSEEPAASQRSLDDHASRYRGASLRSREY